MPVSSSNPNDFDDQAWGVESDDDDFVSSIAPRTNAPRNLRPWSSSRSSSFTAPQSRPNPTPLSDQHRSASSSSSNAAVAVSDSTTHTSSNATASATRSSWMMVETSRSSSGNADVASISEASLPNQTTSEPNHGSAGSGFQIIGRHEANNQLGFKQGNPIPTVHVLSASQNENNLATSTDNHVTTQQEQDDDDLTQSETEQIDLDTGKNVVRKRSSRRKRRPGKHESETLRKAIREDVEDLVQDPSHALSRLCQQWMSSSSQAATTTSESSSLSYQLEAALAGAQATLESPREFTFDPVAAAGDGLIMSGPSFSETSDTSNAAIPTSISNPSVIPEEPANANGASLGRKKSIRTFRRRQQLLSCLYKQSVDLVELRKLAWAGIPDELRPIVWQLLLGYLPAVASVRASTLARKRAEYAAGVKLAFAKGTAGLDQTIWHQIHIDVPRTNPGIQLWQRQATQRALERILYVWAIRHPASGYVQGINDLATPFFEVFLSAYITSDPEMYDVSLLPPHALEALEADTFWCLSKLLDGIQDNYIFAQPGIQRQVRRMAELVARIDAPLHAHLHEQGVEYMQFAFRWMNCLLMREMSVRNIVRMWDTYLAEGPDAFSDFHLYVCSVFLHKWSEKLKEMDFQGIIMFLQSLPTQGWSDSDAEMLLSEAFMYKTLFGNTAHLNK